MTIGKITREHLLNDYLTLKKSLGRQPTCTEFARHHHHVLTLVPVFGRPGWTSLLKAAGDRPRGSYVPAKEQAVCDYLHLKEELGRKPTSREYTKRHHSLSMIKKIFGPPGWSNLLKAAGEKGIYYFATRDSLLNEYRALKKKLGRQPKAEEYGTECYGLTTVASIFGKPGWHRLLEAAGDEPLYETNLTADHLIADFLTLQEKLGRRPKLIEYTYQCHTPKVLDRVFGKPGWRNFIKALGTKAIRDDLLTAEHLIQDYRQCCRTLGYPPTQEEFRKRHHSIKVVYRVFGKRGFRKLAEAAGHFCE